MSEEKPVEQNVQAPEDNKDWTDMIAAKGGLDQSSALNDSSKILNQEECEGDYPVGNKTDCLRQ